MNGMYRGLTKDGKVVFGDKVTSTDGRVAIAPPMAVCKGPWAKIVLQSVTEVTFASLAMYTGATDKNRVKIYGSFPVDGKMTSGGDRVRDKKGNIGDVIYHVCMCTMGFEISGEGFYDEMGPLWSFDELEIIIEGGE